MVMIKMTPEAAGIFGKALAHATATPEQVERNRRALEACVDAGILERSPSFFETWVLQQATIAKAAQSKERVDELTDEERIALAVCAGCEIEPRVEGTKMWVSTLRPVGFAKIDGRWHVAQGPRSEGDTIKINLREPSSPPR